MISLPFGTATAVNSSPFYNFAYDELYVGDDAGVLHKFTGVFDGTPTEVTAGWPITVDAGAVLTPPVFDAVTDNAFVGDCRTAFSATSGIPAVRLARARRASLRASDRPPFSPADGSGFPIIDPPMLDPTTGKVFVFVGDSGTLSCVTARNAYVVQANIDYELTVRLSMGAAGVPLHSGAFDNPYLNSSPGSITGNMFVCGKGTLDRPTLRRINFLADGTITAGGYIRPSPLAALRVRGSMFSRHRNFQPQCRYFWHGFLYFLAFSQGILRELELH